MKLLVTIALVSALFSEVYPLRCNECTGSGTEPCTPRLTTCQSGETKCASMNGIAQTAQAQTEYKTKTCLAPAQCASRSINFGISRSTFNVQCCDSDFCNGEIPPPPPSNPNGKKCFTCVGDDCTQTLKCKGTEDHCIKFTESAHGKSLTLKGCASQAACSEHMYSQSETFRVNVNCCQGDLCNSALRIGQSILFLLLVPLASFILFS